MFQRQISIKEVNEDEILEVNNLTEEMNDKVIIENDKICNLKNSP